MPHDSFFHKDMNTNQDKRERSQGHPWSWTVQVSQQWLLTCSEESRSVEIFTSWNTIKGSWQKTWPSPLESLLAMIRTYRVLTPTLLKVCKVLEFLERLSKQTIWARPGITVKALRTTHQLPRPVWRPRDSDRLHYTGDETKLLS